MQQPQRNYFHQVTLFFFLSLSEYNFEKIFLRNTISKWHPTPTFCWGFNLDKGTIIKVGNKDCKPVYYLITPHHGVNKSRPQCGRAEDVKNQKKKKLTVAQTGSLQSKTSTTFSSILNIHPVITMGEKKENTSKGFLASGSRNGSFQEFQTTLCIKKGIQAPRNQVHSTMAENSP